MLEFSQLPSLGSKFLLSSLPRVFLTNKSREKLVVQHKYEYVQYRSEIWMKSIFFQKNNLPSNIHVIVLSFLHFPYTTPELCKHLLRWCGHEEVWALSVYMSLPVLPHLFTTTSISLTASVASRPVLVFHCWDYFRPKHKDAKILENHINHVMLVFIG